MSALKTLIIIVQTVILLAAACFTRPADSDFQSFVHRNMRTKADGLMSVSDADAHADAVLKQCTLRDRMLWVEAVRDGQVIYVGALGHWFDRSMVDRNQMSSGFTINLSR